MIATDAEVWARLRLVQGRSNAELWEFVSAGGQTLLTVGSHPTCTWHVPESGVAPIHFSLHWDGSALSIADTHGVGRARVDGAPIGGEWRRLSGRARIDFGQAAIVVETSGAPLESKARDTAPLPPVSRETRRASSAPPIHAQVSGAPLPKGTLLGVPPLQGRADSIVATVSPRTAAPPPAANVRVASTPSASGSGASSGTPSGFVPKRPGDSVRAPKPTLLGMAQSSVPPAAAPAVAISTAPPPQRVGGSSLAGEDQRTIQGFPAAGVVVQAAVSVAVGSPSSQPPRQTEAAPTHASAQARFQGTAQVIDAHVTQTSEPGPSTALAVMPREETGKRWRQRAEPANGQFDRAGPGVPPGVLVLSPIGGPSAQPQTGQRRSMAPSRRLPSWRPIAFGVLATLITYGCWLYLLYHL